VIVWERNLHQSGRGTKAAIAPGYLVVHERRTRLVSLDPDDGSVRWDVPAGTWPRDLVLAHPYCLVLPQSPSDLLCLDVHTGTLVWRVELATYTGGVSVAGDVVLAGGWRGYTPVRAFDLATGAPKPVPSRPPARETEPVVEVSHDFVRLLRRRVRVCRRLAPNRLLVFTKGTVLVAEV
jgi:outer membrane protein assembly factor BamB